MLKTFALIGALSFVALVPSSAQAAAIVFEAANPGQQAGWRTVNGPSGDGSNGYWDNRSYDSRENAPLGACSAGSLIGGAGCDWKGLAAPGSVGSASVTDPSLPYHYYGLLNPGPSQVDAPTNFFFSGHFDLDWSVLFQLTAWEDTVEFGWYEAGNPNARHAILGAGGPFVANNGNASAPLTATIAGDFGFYYRNIRFGNSPDNEILFFTQSRFNRVGGYFGYFFEAQFVGDAHPFEDEATFLSVVDLSNVQQFAMFRQGDRYWFGLEDQFGRVTPGVCTDLAQQPCADYDFNDFMLAMTLQDRAVPEPTSLALLSAALFGAAWYRRRRS